MNLWFEIFDTLIEHGEYIDESPELESALLSEAALYFNDMGCLELDWL